MFELPLPFALYVKNIRQLVRSIAREVSRTWKEAVRKTIWHQEKAEFFFEMAPLSLNKSKHGRVKFFHKKKAGASYV